MDVHPVESMLEQITRVASNLVAERREKQIFGLVRPRPWWMPGPVYRFLLRELTCIVITQQVPLTFGHIDITPWPSYRDDFLDSTRYAFGPGALPRNEVASLYLKRGLGPEGVTQYEPGTADPALAMKIDKGLGW